MNLYEEVMRHDIIYSIPYAPHRTPWDADLVKIKTSKLKWAKDRQKFFYRWGGPGPDFNEYTAEEYGDTWAFTAEEVRR